jgi:hypothetical protein
MTNERRKSGKLCLNQVSCSQISLFACCHSAAATASISFQTGSPPASRILCWPGTCRGSTSFYEFIGELNKTRQREVLLLSVVQQKLVVLARR